MTEIALIILSVAFALRALWATKRGGTAGIRTLARWRCAGWSLLVILLSAALRPSWKVEGIASFVLIPICGLALWIVMDSKVRAGTRGTLGRTFFGFALLGFSLFTLMWFRIGPAMSDQPLLTLQLTGEKSIQSVEWQMPGAAQRTENLPHLKVEILEYAKNTEDPKVQQSMLVLGDILSVRAQRIRLWWPFEMLGFPPLVWLDGLRGEYLEAAMAKDYPAQLYPLQHPATLLGSSLQAWCTLVWQKAFRAGIPSWWMESAQLESAGISLIHEDGSPQTGVIDVWTNGNSLELKRRFVSTDQENNEWSDRLRSWCPKVICGSGGEERDAPPDVLKSTEEHSIEGSGVSNHDTNEYMEPAVQESKESQRS